MHFHVSISEEELRDAFVRIDQTREAGDAFFNRFSFVGDLQARNYSAALHGGLAVLRVCKRTSAEVYERIHKGTPYYWLGVAAFMVHDFETAVYYFDAGVSEDLRAGARPEPDAESTPGLRFLQLQGDQPEQAAQQLVQSTELILRNEIDAYNRLTGRQLGAADLSIQDVRHHFLRVAVSEADHRWRTLATSFISYFLEWQHKEVLMTIGPRLGTNEPFFIHLFKGCVLFESLLKANPVRPPNERTLGRVLQELHSNLGVRHGIPTSSDDLATLLVQLRAADNSIGVAIELSAKLRNTVGHDFGWGTQLTPESYRELARKVGFACLHALSTLYRPAVP